ncbi:MAG: RDD family protein [Actinomycetota bacterium]
MRPAAQHPAARVADGSDGDTPGAPPALGDAPESGDDDMPAAAQTTGESTARTPAARSTSDEVDLDDMAAAAQTTGESTTRTPAARSTSDEVDLDDLLDRLHDDMDLSDSGRVEVGAALTDARDLERPRDQPVFIETEGGIAFDPTFAGLHLRAVGFVIDTVVVNLALAPGVLVVLATSGIVLGAIGVAIALVGLALTLRWETRSIARRGRWIGNRITSTTVVDARTGKMLDEGRAAGRVVTRHLLSPVLALGFLPALSDRSRRTFHDRVATSVVITRTPEVWTAGDPDPDAGRDRHAGD